MHAHFSMFPKWNRNCFTQTLCTCCVHLYVNKWIQSYIFGHSLLWNPHAILEYVIRSTCTISNAHVAAYHTNTYTCIYTHSTCTYAHKELQDNLEAGDKQEIRMFMNIRKCKVKHHSHTHHPLDKVVQLSEGAKHSTTPVYSCITTCKSMYSRD